MSRHSLEMTDDWKLLYTFIHFPLSSWRDPSISNRQDCRFINNSALGHPASSLPVASLSTFGASNIPTQTWKYCCLQSIHLGICKDVLQVRRQIHPVHERYERIWKAMITCTHWKSKQCKHSSTSGQNILLLEMSGTPEQQAKTPACRQIIKCSPLPAHLVFWMFLRHHQYFHHS